MTGLIPTNSYWLLTISLFSIPNREEISMEQKPMTVVTEILPDRLAELEKYLKPIGEDINNNKVIQFSAFKRLHYCCFIIIKDEDPQPPAGITLAAPILVFEANIDGTAKEFLDDLFKQKPEFMHKVYSCCQGYTKDDQALSGFLQANDRGASAFYIALPGQTREVIEYQQNLRENIESYIDANRPKLVKLQPEQIKQKILEHLTAAVPGFGSKKPYAPSLLVKIGQILSKYSTWVILALLAVVLLGTYSLLGEIRLYIILGLIAAYLICLLYHEMTDVQDERMHWESAYISELQAVEDRQPQNHLSSIIYVKPGKFRLLTLTGVLFFINLVAKVFATQGNLSGIVTIHFARWIILPGKANERNRLLFFSNYDGSWENYLGEFIDHASVGLTAVWSNTESGAKRGFPDTRLLGAVFDEKKTWTSIFPAGARDEQRFKAFARNSQRRELIWYSAYPDLSVKNIGNNMAIHEGLFSDAELSTWLKRL
jgi:hypothetical protein